MVNRRLTPHEASDFAERLDAFGMELTPSEHGFLKTILHGAEAAPDGEADSLDGPDDRTVTDIVIAIHRLSLSPPISVNPQPIPAPPSLDTSSGDG